MEKKELFVRTVFMNSSIENLDLLRSFILKLTDIDIYEVDKINLTSAQKSRIASWCEENNIQIPDLNNKQFWLEDAIEPSDKSSRSADLNAPISSIGIDIQNINEFLIDVDNLSKTNKELKSIFTIKEMSYAESKSNPRETLAGIFAAKEAIFKCRNIDIVNWEEIEIDHIDDKPKHSGFKVSISHSSEYVISVAIPEANDYEKESKKINKAFVPREETFTPFKIFLKTLNMIGALGGILFLIYFLFN